MGRYENIIVIDPDCAKEEEEELTKKIRANFEKMGCNILKFDDWTIRRLAYPIKKKDRGHYYYLLFDGKESDVGNINRYYKNIDLILRHIIVKVEDNAEGLSSPPEQVVFDELEGEYS
ncbi:MAG: 30S ribosomal protein S6 [Syntrophorhabdaceae bacterium]|nr:30S ribosomal protein S6 [Syntrophorhabdaceae bacterium]